VDAAGLGRYVDAWVLHRVAGTPDGEAELAALVACCSPTVHYEDVPAAAVFTGHAGIRQMCELAAQWSSDLEFTVRTRQTDGTQFAFETQTTGTNTMAIGALAATGRRFTLRGVSAGSVDGDGLVVEHRDYWDLGSFLGQIGALQLAG
jgi:hypothetical protein